MEQFRYLSTKWFDRSASQGKTVVSSAATDFKSTIKKLSALDRLVLTGVALWIVILILTFTIVKPEVIAPDDYVEPVPIDTDNIA